MSRLFRYTHVLILVAVASCEPHVITTSGPVEPVEQSRKPETSRPKAPVASLEALVDIAKADLAKRLLPEQLNPQDVEVLQAERVTWRSSALGCPLPDRGYTMVLTPGNLIRLRASGTTYVYHSTLGGPPFLCEPPGRIESPAPPGYSLDPT